MRIETSENLLFDDSDKRCWIVRQNLDGQFAVGFIQCIDTGSNNTKRYCGLLQRGVAVEKQQHLIKKIMQKGEKYDDLVSGLLELIKDTLTDNRQL